jgi:hypothetical protein
MRPWRRGRPWIRTPGWEGLHMGRCFSPTVSCKHRLTLDLIKINNPHARSLDLIPGRILYFTRCRRRQRWRREDQLMDASAQSLHCRSFWCNLWWDGQHQRFMTKEAMAGLFLYIVARKPNTTGYSACWFGFICPLRILTFVLLV